MDKETEMMDMIELRFGLGVDQLEEENENQKRMRIKRG